MNDEFRGISYSVSGCTFQNESDVNSVSVEPVSQSTMKDQYTTPPSSRMLQSGLGGGGLGGGGGESNSPISKCCIGHFIKGYKSKAGFVTPSFSPSRDSESESDS